MACQLVLAPSFPVLLNRLVDDLRGACRENQPAPKWVVTPTSTSANYLRLHLAQKAAQAVFTGVRVVPILGFLRRFSGSTNAAEFRRWGPALDLLLFELVEGLPSGSPLARLHALSGGHRLLRPTFLDLADGGFGSEQLELLEELADEPDLSAVEAETLRLYAGWVGMLKERGLQWEPLTHQGIPEWIAQAGQQDLHNALACEAGQIPRVYIYGFYEFTDVNAQSFASLARRIEVRLYYPFTRREKMAHPAFSFAEPVLEDLKIRLGTAFQAVEEGEASPRATVFFLSNFPEGDIPKRPPFLTFQRASGIRAELISAAVQIRRWMDGKEDPVTAGEIMVVAPGPEPYLHNIRDIFRAFAIPLRLLDVPAGITPENRPLQILGRIWADEAPAEWLLNYLRDYPTIPAAAGIEVGRFEHKVREWGVWGGASWQLILDLDPEDANSEERELPEFSREEKTLVREILDLWVSPPSPESKMFTPEQAEKFLEVLRDRWLPAPSQLDPLLDALRAFRISSPGLSIKGFLLRELVLLTLNEQIQSESMDGGGVVFVPLMRARGLTAKAVVVLGLASGTLPARIQEDPLLSDAARSRIVKMAQQVGHRLPIKSHVTDEMSLLFFLINSCAESVHWVIPETDDMGRSVAPTPWVQRYIQRWDSEEEKISSRIARGPSQQAGYLLELDRKGGAFVPPDFLVFVQPKLARLISADIPYAYLLDAGSARRKDPAWNGCIPEAAVPAARLEKDRVRVTQLEKLARCPYRFYAESFQEWEPLTLLQFSADIPALDWGRLLHVLLEHLIKPYLNQKKTMRQIAAQLLGEDGRRLKEAVMELPRLFPRRLGIQPEVFRQATLGRLLETAGSYLRAVANREYEDACPVELELRCQQPFPGLEEISISGQIDRVDVHHNTFHIYDYKSSGAPRFSKELNQEVSWGYRIQPWLYPWLFARERGEECPTEFFFVFLGEDPPQEKRFILHSSVEGFLEPFAGILRRGMYLPTPTQALELLEIPGANPCRHCSYTSLCRRFDPGALHRYARLSRERLRSWLDRLTQPDGEDE